MLQQDYNPRILVGEERTKFVKTVMASTFNPENTDAETVKISEKIGSRVKDLMAQQRDPKHLETQQLPPIPKDFKGPIVSNGVENCRNNSFVVTNDTHIRATNPGYSRNEKGGFFCH